QVLSIYFFLSDEIGGSVLSVYSGDFGSVDAQGTVEFALDYDEKNREFQIHVSQCKDLAVVDEKKEQIHALKTCAVAGTRTRSGLERSCLLGQASSPASHQCCTALPLGL
uniref:Uncharacterized protein n=1 Tax=Buteo japonicus TaxID=224669 RepID=A0A8B9ZCY7_9AVES